VFKRVVALPGETWQERNGFVYIDGKRLDEPYVLDTRRDVETHPPLKIPLGRYFFMGDNRASSCDSRRWGTVPASNIIGKVVRILRVA
jgi:signal peptidase I